MIQYIDKSEGAIIELPAWRKGCWINITPPFDRAELHTLANKLDIPQDFLDDSLDIDERSRYEVEDDVKLIVLNMPRLNDSEGEDAAMYATVPIGIVLTPQNIITITSYANSIIHKFIDGKIRNFNPNDRGLFVLQIMEQTVYSYLNSLKDLNVRRNALEKELYNSSRNRELKKLLSLEKSLVYFVTALSSNALLKAKLQRTDILGTRSDEDKADLLEDIMIDNSQAQEMANIYSNILSGTMDAFGSIISNNLNIVMKRLTLVTIILMVPTIVASFYGMNVQHLPGAQTYGAFWVLIGLSIGLSSVLVLVFRRMRLF